MEITIGNIHWIEGGKPQEDLCAHANVSVTINDIQIQSSTNDFTVSAMCLFLLRSLSQNYNGKNEWGNFLIPCCGHSIWKNDNIDEVTNGNIVYVGGCCNGIDWEITHKNNTVIHSYQQITEKMEYKAWGLIVLKLCEKVENFYNQSAKKEITDEWEKQGYDLFWKEWEIRKLNISST